MKLPKLILASGSPRRSEILTSVGWEFTKITADIDETELTGESPADYVRRLALEKAETVAAMYEGALVLGADTTVVIDNQIIGKPFDADHARRMLKLLSGRWHEVLTGVAVVCLDEETGRQGDKETGRQGDKETGRQGDKETRRQGDRETGRQGDKETKSKIQNLKSKIGLQTTRVKFAEMSEAEIDFLAEFGEPLDKAGAYAVQAQAALFIEEIRGDYWNVVGLPVNLVYNLVKDFA